MSMQGKRHSEETKQRLSEAHKGRKRSDDAKRRQTAELKLTMDERIARDRELLAALGQTKTWEYAEIAGVSEKVAKERLRRLFERGLAERVKERGQIGWTYEAKETE